MARGFWRFRIPSSALSAAARWERRGSVSGARRTDLPMTSNVDRQGYKRGERRFAGKVRRAPVGDSSFGGTSLEQPPHFKPTCALRKFGAKRSFLLDRARPVFFSARAKRKWGVHCLPSSWHPPYTSSLQRGMLMHRGPPRPRLSSALGMVWMRTPASSRERLVT